MITGELKNKVDKIWEIFWTGGITNPLEVIEQFNYLLFIKQLDEVETRKERDANILGIPYEGIFPADCQQYRWSKFKNLGDANEIYDLMMNGVFPFIKNLHPDGESAYSKYMGDAIFKIPTPALLTKVIDGIDGLNLEGDSKGDLYEYLLSKLESAAVIVPDGVLFGSSRAHKAIRKELIENHKLDAVISMPSGVFKPYAGVSTAILLFTKTGAGGTDKVWFYDMKADGRTLDDKRQEIEENDIPDIIERYQNLEKEEERKRTEQSFFVPKEEIVENDYDLSINKYKEIEYIPVEYPPTEEILKDIEELEVEIHKNLVELRKMLEENDD